MESRPNIEVIPHPYTTLTVDTNKRAHVRDYNIVNADESRSVNLDQLIYVASPYHHEDEEMMEWRYTQVAMATAHFMLNGFITYSPIAHTHSIAARHTLPRDFKFYERFDLTMISRSNEVWALAIDGWKASKGVKAELAFCQKQQIPFRFILPKTVTSSYVFEDETEYFLTGEITDWTTPLEGIYESVEKALVALNAVKVAD